MCFSKTVKKNPTQKCYEAIQSCNPKKVKKALAKGADVNTIVKNEFYPEKNFLQMALSSRNTSIIKMLLEAPAINVNSYPPGSYPPLHWAIIIANGTCDHLHLLLKHPKININILDEQGNTCLFTVINNFLVHTFFIGKTLLDNKLDITIANKKGNTILHHICYRNSYLTWVNLLLTVKNAPINAQNKQGDTPLHIACRSNAFDIIKTILKSEHKNISL